MLILWTHRAGYIVLQRLCALHAQFRLVVIIVAVNYLVSFLESSLLLVSDRETMSLTSKSEDLERDNLVPRVYSAFKITAGSLHYHTQTPPFLPHLLYPYLEYSGLIFKAMNHNQNSFTV